MVWSWIGIIIGLIVFVLGIILLVGAREAPSFDRKQYLWGGIAAIVIGLLMAIGIAYWLYGTEGGARSRKSFQSTTQGGLTRVVTVYDMEGDQIEQYSGTFDVDANAERIIFDVPQIDGPSKRIQIWSSTGTVTIEEK